MNDNNNLNNQVGSSIPSFGQSLPTPPTNDNPVNNLNIPVGNPVPSFGETTQTTPTNDNPVNNLNIPVGNPVQSFGETTQTTKTNDNPVNNLNIPVGNPVQSFGEATQTTPTNDNPVNNLNIPVSNPVPSFGETTQTTPTNDNPVNNLNIPVGNPVPSFGETTQTTPTNDNPVNNLNIPVSNPVPSTEKALETPSANNEDEELLRAYIGNNYEKITTRKFNFAAFFLTSLYLFYRKMFLYGILAFLATIIISTIIKIPALGLIINVLLGIFFNKLYVSQVKEKINKIKSNNPDKDINALKEICTKKGGTSIGLALLGGLVNCGLLIAIIAIMMLLGIGSIFGSIISELMKGINQAENNSSIIDNNTNEDSSNGSTYNGILLFDVDYDIKDYFTISNIPEKFEDDSNESSYKYMYSGTEGVFNDCKFELSSPSGYSDANVLIDQMANYNKSYNPTNIETTTINNIDWYGFSYENDFGITYYYGTSKNGKPFLLEYEINKDADSDCASYKTEVLNAINQK